MHRGGHTTEKQKRNSAGKIDVLSAVKSQIRVEIGILSFLFSVRWSSSLLRQFEKRSKGATL